MLGWPLSGLGHHAPGWSQITKEGSGHGAHRATTPQGLCGSLLLSLGAPDSETPSPRVRTSGNLTLLSHRGAGSEAHT